MYLLFLFDIRYQIIIFFSKTNFIVQQDIYFLVVSYNFIVCSVKII